VAERNAIEGLLAETLPKVIALHPGALARYEQQLSQLQQTIAKGVAAGNTACNEALRDVVETVTVRRNPTRAGGVESKSPVASTPSWPSQMAPEPLCGD
jgi:hypothetical protein